MASLKELIIETYNFEEKRRSKSNDSQVYLTRGSEFYEKTKFQESQKQERLQKLRSPNEATQRHTSHTPHLEKDLLARLYYKGREKSARKEIVEEGGKPLINPKSLYLLSQSIQSDFERALKVTDCFESFIRRDKYEQVMQEMGYCSRENQETPKKIKAIWNILCNGQKYIYVQNLRVIIYALEGCCFPWMVRSGFS
mmetsp:Transcript_7901/g.7409  ORF Transcript_7901/g.7409 Transcript_7901/m.7409 type:complete len:197 (+) Transcript_7901:688-1278(+)